MSIWVTSLLQTSEILNMILEKYQITSDQENYGLFLVKDSGGMYFFLKRGQGQKILHGQIVHPHGKICGYFSKYSVF